MGSPSDEDKTGGVPGQPREPEPTPPTEEERPLPFVLRVHRWVDVRDAPGPGEGIPIMFRRRAGLTGDLTLTQNGGDVQFTDIGVAP
jgi:hypothetical protein